MSQPQSPAGAQAISLNDPSTSARSRSHLGLLALMAGLVGLLLASITDWAIYGLALGILGALTGSIALGTAKRDDRPAWMSRWGIAASILAMLVFCVHLLVGNNV